MKKVDELTDPNSCWNKGRDDERMFVLLARDVAAPEVIRYWVDVRRAMGKNVDGDPQIVEALECAVLMEQERADEQRLRQQHHEELVTAARSRHGL